MVKQSWKHNIADDVNDDNALLMAVVQLSISLGDYAHDVLTSLAILKQPPSPNLMDGPSEIDLIEQFQQKFDELSQMANAYSNNVNSHYFIHVHKHLKTLVQDELQRVQLLDHLYKLFDAAHPTVGTPYEQTLEDLFGW
ncbi:uncharacterized protein [Drosophila kikkawai]|uniref:Uncharacterized protein n=1 Tax=Drosophila kikkawai TaxID=30033 RepID=A0A6P4J164_DROKI|nr:uncharacterized protein LOC108083391 [Drosophila kikkawai]